LCPSTTLFRSRDGEAEARPADETAEAEQGQRSAFCKPAATGAAKAGNRNHQGEGISVARLRAEMGSPWSVKQKAPAACQNRRGSQKAIGNRWAGAHSLSS